MSFSRPVAVLENFSTFPLRVPVSNTKVSVPFESDDVVDSR